MANFNLDGIQFTADNTSMLKDGQRTVKFGNVENGDFSEASEYGVLPFVNAVEIDWNGAQLGDKEINTTGELLSYISGVANNIPEVPADVITESKLSAKGYITSGELSTMGYITADEMELSAVNVESWVSSNFVEKPSQTTILAGVVTLNEKIDFYDNNQVKNVILNNIAVNLHNYNWKYTNSFNAAYVSTNNIDVDNALYGTIKCTTNTSGYLYLVTVNPIFATNDVMSELPSPTHIHTFSYISSNTLPSALDLNNFINYNDVMFFAYVKAEKQGQSPLVKAVWLADEVAESDTYTIQAIVSIYDCNTFIGSGALLNIYTSFLYTPPTVPPTQETPSKAPTKNPSSGTSTGTTQPPTSITTEDPTTGATESATSEPVTTETPS